METTSPEVRIDLDSCIPGVFGGNGFSGNGFSGNGASPRLEFDLSEYDLVKIISKI